ncbi:putative ATPase [Hamadaea flava]|uniref:ATP-dependent endonuclease n=1 Tax=Hamadaea flava TaxID=1742688 RepID=A0ABV8LZH4_9ACTN|nr:ATP-binding protein [Hamadaea flava]MCP2329397.1 putative ATPase [Hamadaea flava]
MKITSLRVRNWKCFKDTGTLDLGDINVFVGRNNAGKSAVLKALHCLQEGAEYGPQDVRIGADEAEINLSIGGEDLTRAVQRRFGRQVDDPMALRLRMSKNESGCDCALAVLSSRTETEVSRAPAREPDNLMYTYLAKRKVVEFDRVVDIERTRAVATSLKHLVAKVNRLANVDYARSAEYADLCARLLGFRVSAFPAAGGHQAGISVGRFDTISIESMGDGVSSLLGLIADLCMEDGNVYLIEEPENDVHPQALKALLEVIVQRSSGNQFFITTHSNIVLRHLGAAPDTKIFAVEADEPAEGVPVSAVRPLESTPQARIEILRDLGYELIDFDLYDGWLILEESSAESIIRSYLVPWFVPRLTRVRTVSAGGTSKVKALFEDCRRLFLYVHLNQVYRGRAWVIADGEPSGQNAIRQLQATYSDWPTEHFRVWSQPEFERYYPARFGGETDAALALSGDARRSAKKALLLKVLDWCEQEPTQARQEFEVSAKEVVDVLREIDARLFS